MKKHIKEEKDGRQQNICQDMRRGKEERARSGDVTQELGLEDELALLVLLGSLVGLVVLPAHRLLALAAGDVADDVAAGGHVALRGLASVDVDD